MATPPLFPRLRILRADLGYRSPPTPRPSPSLHSPLLSSGSRTPSLASHPHHHCPPRDLHLTSPASASSTASIPSGVPSASSYLHRRRAVSTTANATGDDHDHGHDHGHEHAAPRTFSSSTAPAITEPYTWRYILSTISTPDRVRLVGGLTLGVICTTCNLAAPVLTGLLVEYLGSGAPLSQAIRIWTVLAVVYTVEPVLTQIYIRTVTRVLEGAVAHLRRDLFQRLVANRVEFFDEKRHEPAALMPLLSVELTALRDVGLGCLGRDRGLRAVLEALGSGESSWVAYIPSLITYITNSHTH